MTQAEMAAELAEREGLTKSGALQIIKTIVSIIRDEVHAEGRIRVTNLGVFTKRSRKERMANVPGGEKRKVPARFAIHFKPSDDFKAYVN
jgi:nucleoid DNA-binding protein